MATMTIRTQLHPDAARQVIESPAPEIRPQVRGPRRGVRSSPCRRGVAALFFSSGPDVRTISHRVVLPSGRPSPSQCAISPGASSIQTRRRQDSFVLEYVSTVPQGDLGAIDRETLEVFELIRPCPSSGALPRQAFPPSHPGPEGLRTSPTFYPGPKRKMDFQSAAKPRFSSTTEVRPSSTTGACAMD